MATDLVLQLMIATLTHASELGALLQRAQAENRDVTAAELDAQHVKYDDAKAKLLALAAQALNPPVA